MRRPRSARPIEASGIGTTAGCLLLVAIACLLPFITQQYVVTEFSAAMYLALGVLSVNLLTGFNGQISLGHGAFFGLGAYIAAVLVSEHGWTYPEATPVAVVVVGVGGALVGIPALRIRGLYMALTTLAVGLVFPELIEKFQGSTGGADGKAVSPPVPPPWLHISSQLLTYFVSLVTLIVAAILVRNVVKSRLGRALVAVRDHDLVAESFGVRLASVKVATFAGSAALAAMGGVLLLMQTQYIAPSDFSMSLSLDFFVGMAIGGSTTIIGAVVGGLFLEFAPVYLPDVHVSQQLTPALYGALLILLVYFLPEGVAGGARELARRLLPPRRAVPPAPPGGPPAANHDHIEPDSGTLRRVQTLDPQGRLRPPDFEQSAT
jgi:branched-chain amino acid transport system permease protein